MNLGIKTDRQTDRQTVRQPVSRRKKLLRHHTGRLRRGWGPSASTFSMPRAKKSVVTRRKNVEKARKALQAREQPPVATPSTTTTTTTTSPGPSSAKKKKSLGAQWRN
ncbi:uncharacterized protein LOC135115334 [Scylla paramamosain]|uniref:uncharacterized protein LOC135115334 n=1 Tax=Scylla paramamosain TaxID=85552 RepID=UPI003083C069